MAELPPECREVDEDLSALIDEELSAEREAELRAHLEGCGRCARRLEELCNADLALASLPASAPSPELWARLERRLAGAAGPRRTAPPRPGRRWLAGPAALAATAAALALVVYGTLRFGAPQAPEVETLARRTPPPAGLTPGAPAVAPPAGGLAGGAAPRAAEAPQVAATPAPPAEEMPLGDLSDEELALLLDLDQVTDLGMIANLDLVESFLQLEAGGGAG